jgi:hypothetical protein
MPTLLAISPALQRILTASALQSSRSVPRYRVRFVLLAGAVFSAACPSPHSDPTDASVDVALFAPTQDAAACVPDQPSYLNLGIYMNRLDQLSITGVDLGLGSTRNRSMWGTFRARFVDANGRTVYSEAFWDPRITFDAPSPPESAGNVSVPFRRGMEKVIIEKFDSDQELLSVDLKGHVQGFCMQHACLVACHSDAAIPDDSGCLGHPCGTVCGADGDEEYRCNPAGLCDRGERARDECIFARELDLSRYACYEVSCGAACYRGFETYVCSPRGLCSPPGAAEACKADGGAESRDGEP